MYKVISKMAESRLCNETSYNDFKSAKKALEEAIAAWRDAEFTIRPISDVCFRVFFIEPYHKSHYEGCIYIKKIEDQNAKIEAYKATHDGMTPEEYRAYTGDYESDREYYEREARRDAQFYNEAKAEYIERANRTY